MDGIPYRSPGPPTDKGGGRWPFRSVREGMRPVERRAFSHERNVRPCRADARSAARSQHPCHRRHRNLRAPEFARSVSRHGVAPGDGSACRPLPPPAGHSRFSPAAPVRVQGRGGRHELLPAGARGAALLGLPRLRAGRPLMRLYPGHPLLRPAGRDRHRLPLPRGPRGRRRGRDGGGAGLRS